MKTNSAVTRVTTTSAAAGGVLVLVALVLAAFAVAALGGEVAPVDTLLARGDRALDAGDADAAEALFLEVLELSGKEHRAEHGLAVVGLMRDDHDSVIEHARRAIKRDKKNSGYHLTLAYGYGLKAQQGGLQSLFYAGKFKGECETALKYDPENVDAHMALVQYYVMAPGIAGGGMDKALTTAATISGLDPFQGHLASAFIARHDGDVAAAESAYSRAASVDTTRAGGWIPLAAFYMEEERYDEAIPVGERILRLEPDNHGVVYQLAKAHLLLGDDLDAALRGFTEYLEAGVEERGLPDPAAAHWRLGMVHDKAGRPTAARESWETALALSPGHKQATACLDTLRTEHPELW
ncbi:MAG: tetratricopeptide repeat protein [Candidatus Eisenbacteria bacterium]